MQLSSLSEQRLPPKGSCFPCTRGNYLRGVCEEEAKEAVPDERRGLGNIVTPIDKQLSFSREMD